MCMWQSNHHFSCSLNFHSTESSRMSVASIYYVCKTRTSLLQFCLLSFRFRKWRFGSFELLQGIYVLFGFISIYDNTNVLAQNSKGEGAWVSFRGDMREFTVGLMCTEAGSSPSIFDFLQLITICYIFIYHRLKELVIVFARMLSITSWVPELVV